ncbi:MAG: hypothetical protein ACI9MR_001998 [Myxococcota bacterium]|jgi:hypothetical protein
MSSIRIKPRSVDKATVKDTLVKALPDLEIGNFGVHTSVAENRWAGVAVMVMKARIQVTTSIPSFGMLVVGVLILLLGSIVIPAILYGTKVVPRQKAVEARVVAVLERELADHLVT